MQDMIFFLIAKYRKVYVWDNLGLWIYFSSLSFMKYKHRSKYGISNEYFVQTEMCHLSKIKQIFKTQQKTSLAMHQLFSFT